MDLTIIKNIRDNQKLRESFIELAIQTFDLSFEAWYQDGYWMDKYIPYAIVEEGKVVANASVNIIDTVFNDQPKRYIQIGTVMTGFAHRNKGLSRHIMEEILKDWKDKCDAMYLFANNAVLEFYPKFGFQKEIEHQYKMSIVPKLSKVKKVDMSTIEGREFLKKYYKKSNPFSALPMLDNYGLLMFYCTAFMKDCVFYCKEFDAVVIATQNEDALLCLDIYCDNDKPLLAILSSILGTSTNPVILGFTPKDTSGCTVSAIEEEAETLFILKTRENIFAQDKVMFPRLSHA